MGKERTLRILRRRALLVTAAAVAAFTATAPAALAEDPAYNGSSLWLRYERGQRCGASRAVPGRDLGRDRRERRSHQGVPAHGRPEDGGGRDRGARRIDARGGARGAVRGLGGLLDQAVPVRSSTPGASPTVRSSWARGQLADRRPRYLTAAWPRVGPEGYVIRSIQRGRDVHGDRRQQELGALYGDLRVPAAVCRRSSRSRPGDRRPRRRSSTGTSTTGTRNACTPATTRRGPAASTARTARCSTSPPPAPAPLATCR